MDRVSTAVVVSREAYADGAAAAVVLARADTFADALAGAPLAVQQDGPLLLTPGDALPDVVLGEIRRVLAPGGQVHLLGGSAAIGPEVESALTVAGYGIRRYAGSTRYTTAVLIAHQGLGDPEQLLLATGADFPDALTAGAAAARGGAVLLTDDEDLPEEVRAYLAARPEAVRFAVGGPAAAADPGAVAITGADRYETAVLAARAFFPAGGAVGIASGTDFADSLVGGPHIGHHAGPLLLTDPDRLPDAVRDYLAAEPGPSTVYVYGGEGAVAAAVDAAVTQTLG